MNKYAIRLTSILLVLCMPYLLGAQEFAKVGTSGTQFLKLGVGARSVGLGGAFVAVVNDASSVYWNPSLSSLQRVNASMARRDVFEISRAVRIISGVGLT